MNKRIKELITHAGIHRPERFNTLDGGNQLERLAELIVKEMCTDVVQPYMSRFPGDCDLVIKMKQHFGAEE